MVILRDWFHNDAGEPVQGIWVEPYAVTVNGQNVIGRSDLPVAPAKQSDSYGMYEFDLDPALAPGTGLFDLKIYNETTNQVRWRKGKIAIQVDAVVGAFGSAPIADAAITESKISNSSVTSIKIPVLERTGNPAITGDASNVGTLAQLFSWLMREILRIKGTVNWTTTVPATLSDLRAHLDNRSNPHQLTYLDVSAVRNRTNVPEMRATTIGLRDTLTPTVGTIFIATDTRKQYRYNGTAWDLIATTDYNDLTNKPSLAGGNDFSSVKAGVTTLTPDSSTDTLNINGGAGISVVGSNSSKTITISALSSGGGGSTSAHTHSGDDITTAVGDSDKLNSHSGVRFPYSDLLIPASGSWSSTTQQVRFSARSAVVSMSSGGNATVPLPSGINGIFSIVACNGDWNAHANALVLVSTDPGYASFVVKFVGNAATPYTQNVRVNYIVFYW